MSKRETPTLKYKGYTGTVEVSIEDGCLHGRIQHVDDLITYEGGTVSALTAQFEQAVDEYLSHCEAIGKQPQRQYGGTFNVRVGPNRHKWIVQYGTELGLNLNDIVCMAIDRLKDSVAASAARPIARKKSVHGPLSMVQKVNLSGLSHAGFGPTGALIIMENPASYGETRSVTSTSTSAALHGLVDLGSIVDLDELADIRVVPS
jgi:predicted HicB family RNase H-like nuclease